MLDYYLIFIIALAAVSLITFILYGADKSKAKRGAWRIKESVLIGFSLLCGAAGGMLAMNVFRHKTKHWYFWLWNIVGLVWQAGVLILLIVLSVNGTLEPLSF